MSERKRDGRGRFVAADDDYDKVVARRTYFNADDLAPSGRESFNGWALLALLMVAICVVLSFFANGVREADHYNERCTTYPESCQGQ